MYISIGILLYRIVSALIYIERALRKGFSLQFLRVDSHLFITTCSFSWGNLCSFLS